MNDEQLLRYSRHILLPDFDIDGQQQVLESRVLVIGLGGLGSPVTLYLAAAGVGHLVLVDDDRVELTNLQRQIVHRQSTLGMTKTASAAETLQNLNNTIIVETIDHRLSEAELIEQATQADVIVDCTDNFSTRFLLNRVSKKPPPRWFLQQPYAGKGKFRYMMHGKPMHRAIVVFMMITAAIFSKAVRRAGCSHHCLA